MVCARRAFSAATAKASALKDESTGDGHELLPIAEATYRGFVGIGDVGGQRKG